MPARLEAKATDVEWTADGRVVVLSGTSSGSDFRLLTQAVAGQAIAV
jgi:hypothetical protein